MNLVESRVEMPPYMAKHLPGITAERWRITTLQRARECTEECVDISRELEMPDMLTRSQDLLARIDELTEAAHFDSSPGQ